MSSRIDTTPIKKAYDEYTNIQKELNKLQRNTIFKTILAFASCVVAGFALAAASFGLAGIAIPVAALSFKQISILTFSMGIGVAGSFAIAAKITHTFRNKAANIMKSFSPFNNFADILEPLLGIERLDIIGLGKKIDSNEIFKMPNFTISNGNTEMARYYVGTLTRFNSWKIDSYEIVEKRYVEKQENLGFFHRLFYGFKKPKSA